MADLKKSEPASKFALKGAKNSTDFQNVESTYWKADNRNTQFFVCVVFQAQNNVTSVDSAKHSGCLLMSKQGKMLIRSSHLPLKTEQSLSVMLLTS
jgi:hypothetical protein